MPYRVSVVKLMAQVISELKGHEMYCVYGI